LLKEELDLIVHSCKDVPTTLDDDFEIACSPEREDPRDGVAMKEGLPYKRLEDLPAGSVVGTGSVRRVAQLKRAFPGLVFQDMVSFTPIIRKMYEAHISAWKPEHSTQQA
jgi:hydroxymethylbilane synthase